MIFQSNCNGTSNCPSPPFFPIETFQFKHSPEAENQNFNVNDLIEAIKDSDVEKLMLILGSKCVNLGFKIPDYNDGTILHFAVQHSSLPIVHMLISAGVEIDMFDKEQNTPLMSAILCDKNDMVQYLIKAGASINLKGTDGMSALHLAAKCGNIKACELLVDGVTIKNYVNCQDDGGWTPLVWACEHGYVEVANYLISKGADPSLRDVEHNVALHWAAFSGSSQIASLLLNRNCEVNAVNAHGDTPLHIGAREDMHNCVVILLAHGADVNIINKNNESPLDCVPEGGDCYNVISLNVHLQSITSSDNESFKIIVSNDISKGRETNPIQCINVVDDDPFPTDFCYITKNCTTVDGINIDRKVLDMHRCNCDERCIGPDCGCGKLSLKCWYDEEGKLVSDFNYADTPLIFECHELCSCNAITCSNRVVQKGLTQRFQVFKTENKGWGVKSLRFIPKGSFVCEYVGELLTDTLSEEREDDSYLFDLDIKDKDSFCVDARLYGNFTRFINHSCNPNLLSVKVFVDHQDLRFPRIAFFASRDIMAEEELGFDYGEKFWLVKYKSFTCHCESQDCKYSEERFRQILNNYQSTL